MKSCTLDQPYSIWETRLEKKKTKLPKRKSHTSIRKKKNNLKNSYQNEVVNKEESFNLLESLFSLEKPFHLTIQDFPLYLTVDEKEREVPSDDSLSECQFGNPEDFIEKLKPSFSESENFIEKSELSSPTINERSTPPDLQENEENYESVEEESKLSETREYNERIEDISILSDLEKDNASTIMADSEMDGGFAGDANETASFKYKTEIKSEVASTVPSCSSTQSMASLGKEIDPTEDKERVKVIKSEIEDLKACITDLSKKPDLSNVEMIKLKELQDSLLSRIGEFNEITRRLQKKLVEISQAIPCADENVSQVREEVDKFEETRKDCERFAFPQPAYPEDKLPRYIICGNAEDNFPKIAVPDSSPKKSKCFQPLPDEDPCKKFLLQDRDVDNLHRKVCGLQAEVRIIAKENLEFDRKLENITQQQHQRQSVCPSPISYSRPKTSEVSKCVTSPPPRTLDLSCKCMTKARSCGRPNESSNSRRPSTGTSGCCGVTRLAGGGIRDDSDCCGGGAKYRCKPKSVCAAPTPSTSELDCADECLGCKQTCPPAPCSPLPCPAEIDDFLAASGDNAKYLGEQLSCMENEVHKFKADLLNMQRERQQLEQQRKLLECGGPYTNYPRYPEPRKSNQDLSACSPCNDVQDNDPCATQKLNELREQYARLQDDYRSKLCEVSRLRSDMENLRRDARESREERDRFEIKLIDAKDRIRVIEAERNDLLGCRESMVEQEQALLVSKQRFREAQDELEELRTMIRDQAAQLDDYRSKYMQAQQHVEEQRRQLDLMELDNARMNENVTLEIGRVKNQFQEKLAELAPLPEILKQTQIKLQETQQLRTLAEHNCEDLSRELLAAKERIDCMQKQINDLQRQIQSLQDNKSDNTTRIDELEQKNSELRNENEHVKTVISRYEEQQVVIQKRLDEKQHEIVQLTAMLEQVREDSARQVSRTKERCEAIKKSMQAQISDFEIQLAQCRAAAKTAQKERDELSHKMKGQIGNLNEALQQAQGRIRSLQGHVDYLKVSYSTVFGNKEHDQPMKYQIDDSNHGQGYDSCDCNH